MAGCPLTSLPDKAPEAMQAARYQCVMFMIMSHQVLPAGCRLFCLGNWCTMVQVHNRQPQKRAQRSKVIREIMLTPPVQVPFLQVQLQGEQRILLIAKLVPIPTGHIDGGVSMLHSSMAPGYQPGLKAGMLSMLPTSQESDHTFHALLSTNYQSQQRTRQHYSPDDL